MKGGHVQRCTGSESYGSVLNNTCVSNLFLRAMSEKGRGTSRHIAHSMKFVCLTLSAETAIKALNYIGHLFSALVTTLKARPQRLKTALKISKGHEFINR